MSAASGGRRDSSDVDVFLPHSDGETSRYDPLAISGRVPTPTASSSSRVSSRLRIPSVKEVAEKSEGPNWTMSSPAQNLAAALNDPSDREYDLFTRTWGMYFVPNAPLPPSTIPNIQLGDFIRYLKETSSGRKVHRSIVRQLRKESQDEKTCPTSPTSPALPPLISKLHQEGRMFDLSSVPRLFMQADFCLKDLATFQQVLPLQELGPGRRTKKAARSGERGKKNVTSPSPNTPSTPPVSSKLLHEKLSQYLDVIEVHLAHQIAQRSDLFFSTLSSQQELQDHIMSVRQNVVELRMCLRDLDRKLTHKNLELMRLCSQTHRNSQVLQKLKLISTVQQTQPTIQLLLSTSDFVGAIDLITTTQDVLHDELRGVHSLRHLGSQLAEMERAIEKMMEADLVDFAMEDIGLRVKAFSNPSLNSDVTASEERLVSVVYGLLMQSKLHFLTALREGILTNLKYTVKETVKTYLHIPEVEGEGMDSPSLADCMRSMEFDAWLGMLEHLFSALLSHLKTVQSCVKVIASVCERAAGGSSKTGRATKQAARQQSVDQSSTTAMVRETLLKNSTTTAAISTTTTNSHLLNPSISLPAGNLTGGPSNLPSFDSTFEKSNAQFEAEAELELLMMQEEMSDLRVDPSGSVTNWTQPLSGESSQNSTNRLDAGFSGGELERTGGVGSVGLELSPADSSSVSREGGAAGGAVGGVVATTAGVGGGRSQQLTVDSKEKERLEDIMAVAHVDETAQVISQSECQRLVTECHELLAASCDLVHSRCAKILSIRAKAGLLENVASSEFVSLVRLIEHFVHSCTDVTGRQCPTLRSSLLSQAKQFLETFHENRKSKVSLLLDGERWKQADVPAEIQALVQKLETGIPPMSGGRRTKPPESTLKPGQPANKYLMVHNQSFAVLGIVPLLVKIVVEYCQCADDLPNLVSEVMSKLIEVLKFFNGRTCMLVLGAGAVETVGLKTITARHLALVLRCLQAVQLLVADIRRHFQCRLPHKQHILLSHFDHVTEDYSRHCVEINNKIITIMDDLISRNLFKWEAKSPVPSLSFKTLIKQVLKLHENLVDILPHNQLQSLFTSIEEMFKNHLKTQLQRLGITNNGSTQHGTVISELTYFMGALGSLENINAFRSSLFDVWTVNR